jgi:uncharacterized lipoprotein YmbA
MSIALRGWRSVMCLCMASLMACSGPTYQTKHYTLVADASAKPVTERVYPLSLGVGPIRLPELLDHPGIVSHNEQQRVFVAPYDIWAGDLKAAISRVLADNLSVYLNSHHVWPFPWDNRVRPERRISLVLERFGGERGGEVVLQAKWRLLSSDGGTELDSGKIRLADNTPDDSYSAYVETLNALLNRLSEAIAQNLLAQQD